MNNWQALILGLMQGFTEYLPVSSSGHLTICSNLFGLGGEENLTMNITVHVATVLSTCVVLWKEIIWLFKDLFKWQWNDGTKYIVNILISMIPVALVGLLFKDKVEVIFGSGLTVVGICLLITATLLAFAYFAKPRQRESISPWHAFWIGVAQACATLPGLSRSGSTIATGLLLGNKKESMAQFSFLMVIPPILGEALLVAKDIIGGTTDMVGAISSSNMIIAFLAAFISGCLACKWMINIVKKGKLIWFAVYCAIVGIVALTVL
ncbi:MAG: undecaprenyl-diphosphate phosphatase [Bacteroidales bacterium]|nr:undecaprenyl-diphosphate phosphatase [Bacteroidales bacterium]